jgi:elongin-A
MLEQPSTTAAASRGIFGKAKAEAQRAKVALTHASGKFDPVAANRLAVPARPRPTTASSSVSLFSVTQPVVSSTTSGPRIPAPRSVAGGTKRPRETSPIIPLPGARPLAQSRTSLPADIRPTSEPTTHSQDRFKVDSNRFESIKRPRVENFEPPRAPTASFRFGNEQSKTISPGKPSFPKPLNPAEEAARLNSVLFVKKKARPTK